MQTEIGTRFRNIALTAAAAAIALASAAPPDMRAQSTRRAPVPGDRVRIVVPSMDRAPIEGTVASMDLGYVRLDTGDRAPLVVPREDVQALFVLHERRNALVGSLAGTIIGTVVGGTVSAAAWQPCLPSDSSGYCFNPGSRRDAFEIGALAGAVPGLLIGAIAGSLIPSSEWRSFDLDLSFSTEGDAEVPKNGSISPTVRLVIPLGR